MALRLFVLPLAVCFILVLFSVGFWYGKHDIPNSQAAHHPLAECNQKAAAEGCLDVLRAVI
jgi:hypothetical protein